MSERGKAIREWLELALKVGAAVAAVVIFLRYDKGKKDLDLRLATIQEKVNTVTLQKGEIELQGIKDRKIGVTKRLRVKALESEGVYKIDFDYSFENQAGVQMQIKRVLAEVFVGSVPSLDNAAVEINNPFHKGPVVWKPVIQKAFVIEGDSAGAIGTAYDNSFVPAIVGGGGTALLNSGERSNGGLGVLLKTTPTAVLAAYVTATTEMPRDRKQDSWYTGLVEDVATLLADSAPSKSPVP